METKVDYQTKRQDIFKIRDIYIYLSTQTDLRLAKIANMFGKCGQYLLNIWFGLGFAKHVQFVHGSVDN